MTVTDKLQAILDLVFQEPLERQVSVDPDGKKTVTYTQAPLPDPVDLSFIPESQNELSVDNPGPYRHLQLVRFGDTDWQYNQSHPFASWVVVRINHRGADGYNGNEAL